MLKPKFLPVIFKQIYRHPTRSALTIAGVACAMFLFCAVQAMQDGVKQATESSAKETSIVVFRKDRYCPMASQIPQDYRSEIEKIPGVISVIPMRVIPTNCRASLNVITFKGIPVDDFYKFQAPKLKLVSGNLKGLEQASNKAVISSDLASRQGLKVGDNFKAADVPIEVIGIFSPSDSNQQSTVYTDIQFLQQNTGSRKLNIATQFVVKIDKAENLKSIAEAIDKKFETDIAPTTSASEKDFLLRAAKGALQLIEFTRYLGFACLAAVIALVGNAIVLSIQDRIRDHAILQTLGFTGGLIAQMIVVEGITLGVLGGLLGCLGAWLVNHFGQFSLSSEGVTIAMHTSIDMLIQGLVISVLLGTVAGLIPAFQASRREIATCFRAV